MVDLTAEMASLWTALGPAPVHGCRLVLFTSGRRGEGVSTISREFARMAAARARKPVWLVDADMVVQDQVAIIEREPHRFGRPGETVAGSPDGSSFFTILPAVKGADGRQLRPAQFLSAKPFLGRRLFVTRFNSEPLKHGHKPVVLGQGDYWAALRQHAETIVVDAPADVAVSLSAFADAVVMVVGEGGDVSEHLAFQQQLQTEGAPLKGVVLNRSTYQAPRLLRKILG